MKKEDYEKAALLSSKIKIIEDNILAIENAARAKNRFDEDVTSGYKPSFYKKWLGKFCRFQVGEKEQPQIMMNYEYAFPITIEMDNDDFVRLLLDYLNKERKKLESEFDSI